MLAMALGSLVWTLPHFATDPYMPTVAGEEEDGPVLCGTAGSDGREGECSGGGEGGEGGSLAAYRFVFVLGQLLHGLGAAPLITLGTTFLDESVSKRSSPLYIAVFQTWYGFAFFSKLKLTPKRFVIGPAIGFVMGGSLLSLHTDLVRTPHLLLGQFFYFQLSGVISWLDPSLFSLGWSLVARLPPHLCRFHPQCPRPPVLPRQHQPEERHHSGQQGDGGKAQTSTSCYLGSCYQPDLHFCKRTVYEYMCVIISP